MPIPFSQSHDPRNNIVYKDFDMSSNLLQPVQIAKEIGKSFAFAAQILPVNNVGDIMTLTVAGYWNDILIFSENIVIDASCDWMYVFYEHLELLNANTIEIEFDARDFDQGFFSLYTAQY